MDIRGLLVALLVTAATVGAQRRYGDSSRRHGKVVVCYMTSWTYWREEPGKFSVQNVDPNLCTHLIYSFAGLDEETSTIKSLDDYLDLSSGLGTYNSVTSLKSRYRLKVLVAIGGWNEESGKYSRMVEDDGKRREFVRSVVNFLKDHNFDGLDLDWEYPGSREGARPQDKENFVKLVRELKSSFSRDGFLLTAAIGANKATIDKGYDIPGLVPYLDHIHVMCYDYHGDWEDKTGHNTPLFSRPQEIGTEWETLNVNFTINYLKSLGAPPSKLVLGLAFYGRTYTLSNPRYNGIGAPAVGKGFSGKYSKQPGFLGYNEICELQKDRTNRWMKMWDEDYEAPFMYRGTDWVSYDDAKSVAVKAEYAVKEHLAGVMIWSIDTDDFLGKCKGHRYPLLSSINRALELSQINTVDSGARASCISVTSLIMCVSLLVLTSIYH